MYSYLLFHIQHTDAFSCALLWRVLYSSYFECLTSLHIFTGKAEGRSSRYSHLLERIIASEYGMTISSHVIVIRQWLLAEKRRVRNNREI